MIEIRNLSVSYNQSDDSSRPALCDISLRVSEGEFVLLTGPSGCGKSTLVSCLAGLIPHLIPARWQGEVLVHGLDTRKHTVAELARHVGVVYQNPATQLFNETVEEEVAFGPRNLGLGEPEVAASVDRSLRAVGIEHLCRRPLRHLSDGEQQRVAIAAVLAMNPGLLILDEPLANLDRHGVHDVLSSLGELHRLGITILLIEHRLDAVASYVQRVLFMDEGRLVADGPSSSILADWHLLDNLRLRHPRPTPDLEVATSDAFARIAAPVSPLVTLESIVAGYGGHEVLSGVDLQLYEGEFVALVGDNGAGKTTLARVLAGMVRPNRGRVRWAPSQRGVKSNRVGMLFQNPQHQLLCDRVEDEVAYGLLNLNRMSPDSLEALLAAGDLLSLRNQRPQFLSAGQQQRTALAATVAVSPRLLILDEPTLGQDWGHLSQTMDYVIKLNAQGQSVLLITHDEKLVCRYAERVVRLADGRLVAERRLGKRIPKEVCTHEMVTA